VGLADRFVAIVATPGQGFRSETWEKGRNRDNRLVMDARKMPPRDATNAPADPVAGKTGGP
jgi:hypothetical protein